MDWVKTEDARTAKIMEADPRFAAYNEEALKIVEDPNRLPLPDLRGDEVYNFWNDQKNIRGLLRKTTMDDYSTPDPHWQTVLDVSRSAAKTQPPRASSTSHRTSSSLPASSHRTANRRSPGWTRTRFSSLATGAPAP